MPKRVISSERKQAEGALRRSAHELAVLYSISRSASQTLELHDILTASLDEVLKALEVEVGAIYLSDDDHTFRLRLHRGLSAEFVQNLSIAKDDGFGPHQVVLEQKTEHLPKKMAYAIAKEGLKSLAVVPLRAKDHILGKLNLASRRPHAFSQDQIELLASIGLQIGSAVENARLYEQSREQARDLLLLHEVEQLLASTLEEETIYREITRRCVEVFKVDSCLLRLIEGDSLFVKESYFLDPQDREEVMRLLKEAPIRVGEGIAGRVALTGEPLMSGETPTGELTLPTYVGYLRFRHWLVVPMRAKGKVTGVLTLMTRDLGRPFTERDSVLAAGVANQTAMALENAYTFQEEKRRTRIIEALADIANEIAATPDVEHLLDKVTQRTLELLNASDVAIYLVENHDQTAKVVSARGGQRKELLSHSINIGEGITGSVIASGKAEIVNNTRADPRTVVVPGTPQEDGTRETLMSAPLLLRGRPIGAINAWRLRADGLFHESELNFLISIAHQTSISIELGRLFQETSRRAQEAAALVEVGRDISATLQLDLVLERIAVYAQQLLRAETSAVHLYDSTDSKLYAVAALGKDANELKNDPLELGKGIAGDIALKKKGEIVNYAVLDPRAHHVKDTDENPIEHVMAVPVLNGEKLMGLLAVWRTGSNQEFAPTELVFLTNLAQQAAVAIENARLFAAQQRHAARLKVIGEMGRQIASLLDVGELLRQVVTSLVENFGYYYADILLVDFAAGELVLKADAGQVTIPAADYRLKIGREGMTGWVAASGQPLLANDVTREPRYKFVEALKDTRSELAVPIFNNKNKQVIGVLDVQSIEQNAFDEEDLFTLQALAEQTAVAIENAGLYADVRHLSVAAIRSLVAAIDARDPYTHGHSEGVTRLAIQLAQQLGWNRADLEMIEFAALLHDVGKIAVPDAVLKKIEPLTTDDWDYIHLHPHYSAQIVGPIKRLERIIPWIYHHHERWDGNGYPDGLRGENIPLGARIIAVADVYNAMVTNRPYREALPKTRALAEVERCSGSQLDPQIVKVLLKLVRR